MCWHRPPASALKCDKFTLKHICTNSRASNTNTRTCDGLLAPDTIPVVAGAGKIALGGAKCGRGWWEEFLGGRRGHFWEDWASKFRLAFAMLSIKVCVIPLDIN